MAPSAMAELINPTSKAEIAKQPEKHAHGAEDKTPLEAISHGPLLHLGTVNLDSTISACKRSLLQSESLSWWISRGHSTEVGVGNRQFQVTDL